MNVEITKRNANALVLPGIALIGLAGTTQGVSHVVVWTLALACGFGMLIGGISLLNRVISELEKENVELRKKTE